MVELLLVREDVQVNQRSNTGDTPLIIAVREGYVNIAELLLRKDNILVGKANKIGATPLCIAQDMSHAKLVALLRRKMKRPQYNCETCVACLDRTPDVILIPCGCQNLCRECAKQWLKEKKGCPIDRIPISTVDLLEEDEEATRKKRAP